MIGILNVSTFFANTILIRMLVVRREEKIKRVPGPRAAVNPALGVQALFHVLQGAKPGGSAELWTLKSLSCSRARTGRSPSGRRCEWALSS